MTVTQESPTAHRFHFSKNGVATCSCGRWTLAKIHMTATRAQRLARKYGKERFGPRADGILMTGTRFKELTEEEAMKDWGFHVRSLPEKGERVHGCAYIKKERARQGDLAA